MEDIEEYIESIIRTAESLWGREDAEKMRNHIEATATAVYKIGKIKLDTAIEPATKLRHRKQP